MLLKVNFSEKNFCLRLFLKRNVKFLDVMNSKHEQNLTRLSKPRNFEKNNISTSLISIVFNGSQHMPKVEPRWADYIGSHS